MLLGEACNDIRVYRVRMLVDRKVEQRMNAVEIKMSKFNATREDMKGCLNKGRDRSSEIIKEIYINRKKEEED